MNGLLNIYQIGDVVIEPFTDKDNYHGFEIKYEGDVYGRVADLYLWPDRFQNPAMTNKTLTLTITPYGGYTHQEIYQRLKRMGGMPVEIIGYVPVTDCECELTWLQTVGVLQDIATVDETDQAMMVTLEIHHDPRWIPVNRIYWNYTDEATDPFEEVALNAVVYLGKEQATVTDTLNMIGASDQTGTGSELRNLTTHTQLGQTFTPSQSGYVTYVELRLLTTATAPTGNIIISIYDWRYNYLGALLHTQTHSVASLGLTTSAQTIRIALTENLHPKKLHLNAGEQYLLHLSGDYAISATVHVKWSFHNAALAAEDSVRRDGVSGHWSRQGGAHRNCKIEMQRSIYPFPLARQNYSFLNGDSVYELNNTGTPHNSKLAQLFTTTATGWLTGINLHLNGVGTVAPSGLTFEIRLDDGAGGSPGTLIWSYGEDGANIGFSQVSNLAMSIRINLLDTPIFLTNATQYFLVIVPGYAASANHVTIDADTSSPGYTGGRVWRLNSSSGLWEQHPTDGDFTFNFDMITFDAVTDLVNFNYAGDASPMTQMLQVFDNRIPASSKRLYSVKIWMRRVGNATTDQVIFQIYNLNTGQPLAQETLTLANIPTEYSPVEIVFSDYPAVDTAGVLYYVRFYANYSASLTNYLQIGVSDPDVIGGAFDYGLLVTRGVSTVLYPDGVSTDYKQLNVQLNFVTDNLTPYPNCDAFMLHNHYWKQQNFVEEPVMLNPDHWEALHDQGNRNTPATGLGYRWTSNTLIYVLNVNRAQWSANPLSLYALRGFDDAEYIEIKLSVSMPMVDEVSYRFYITIADLQDLFTAKGYGLIEPMDILIIGDVEQMPAVLIRDSVILGIVPILVPDDNGFFGQAFAGYNSIEFYSPSSELAVLHIFRRFN